MTKRRLSKSKKCRGDKSERKRGNGGMWQVGFVGCGSHVQLFLKRLCEVWQEGMLGVAVRAANVETVVLGGQTECAWQENPSLSAKSA